MNTKRYFRVKFGFNASDNVTLPEEEVEKAIYAQATGTPTHLGSAFINGKNIISITPAYHKHTGWYDWYEPTNGDDFAQIKRDCPDYDGLIEHYKERVQYLMQNGRIKEIGRGVEITALLES